MRRLVSHALDYLTIEPLRIRSFLRLVLIVLIALLVYKTNISHWLEEVFTALLVTYAVAAVAWLIFVLRCREPRWWFGWVSTFVDVGVVMLLCIASGPGTISLYPIFFLLPISVAFLDSPVITFSLGLSASLGYLLAWVVYVIRDHTVSGELRDLVFVQVACLLWLTTAITALSFALRRRRTRVLALLDQRRRLVAEAMRADERHNRELSEQLHDGPLQNLLAARLDLDDLREHPTPEGFDRLDMALRDTVAALRTTVTTLHPQVLAQVGLSAALEDMAARYQERWGIPVTTDIDEVGHPEGQALLHRAARELMANAFKHSRASTLELGLRKVADGTTLRVADDGIGFDPRILDQRVAEGHIGLASLVVAVEAAGGSLNFTGRPGEGAVVTVMLPDEMNWSDIERQIPGLRTRPPKSTASH